jgi:hypothetical protein
LLGNNCAVSLLQSVFLFLSFACHLQVIGCPHDCAWMLFLVLKELEVARIFKRTFDSLLELLLPTIAFEVSIFSHCCSNYL